MALTLSPEDLEAITDIVKQVFAIPEGMTTELSELTPLAGVDLSPTALDHIKNNTIAAIAPHNSADNHDVQTALQAWIKAGCLAALTEAGVLTGATFKSSPDVYRRLVDTQYETLGKFLPPKP